MENSSDTNTNSSIFNKSSRNILNITKNPFNDSEDKVHLPLFSPGLLTITDTPKNSSFKWNIDQISMMKPFEISTNVFQEDSFPHLTKYDSAEIQSKVDEYFSNVFLPSPMVSRNDRKIISEMEHDDCFIDLIEEKKIPLTVDNNRICKVKDAGCQTLISIQPNSDIDRILEKYSHYYSTSTIDRSGVSEKMQDKENTFQNMNPDKSYIEKNRNLFYVDINSRNIIGYNDCFKIDSPLRLATPLNKSHESNFFNFSSYDISPILCKTKKPNTESKLLRDNQNTVCCTPEPDFFDKTQSQFTFNFNISHYGHRILEESPSIKKPNNKIRRNLSQNEIVKDPESMI